MKYTYEIYRAKEFKKSVKIWEVKVRMMFKYEICSVNVMANLKYPDKNYIGFPTSRKISISF